MKGMAIVLLVCAAGLVASGCGEGYAAINTVHPPLGHRKVETRETAFQLAKGGIIQIVLARQWSLPGGEAVPDYEYIYLSVPQRKGTYRIGQEGTELYRLVRIEREEFLYRAVSGTVKYGYAFLSADRIKAGFDVETEMVPAGRWAGRRWPLEGKIQATESVRLAQGLINKYHDTVTRLLTPPKPPEETATPQPEGTDAPPGN